MDIHSQPPLKLNLGAGSTVIEGWSSVGFESAHDFRSDVRYIGAVFKPGSVDALMAIHVVEHINRWEVPQMLREWWSVLKPGGTLELEQPELVRCCQNVLDNPDPRYGMWGLFGDPGYKNELMTHRWCWREDELVKELAAAGFRKIRSAPLQFHGRKRLRDFRLECCK